MIQSRERNACFNVVLNCSPLLQMYLLSKIYVIVKLVFVGWPGLCTVYFILGFGFQCVHPV